MKHFETSFPSSTVHCRNEPVATDTIFSSYLAVVSSVDCAQIFVGQNSILDDAYGCK